ncbi:MAG: chromosome segregation protein SMC [Thermodesulfovibrionia bacterium]
MRLERIELIGFKSFADKTTLDFHPGITAIIGPNGCGKSNVVDAFKWVLGEQSAKSLRGDSMEDVIFFGSANRKAKGMAEVTLVISGVNGTNLPGNGDSNNMEVSVTRRLYRSGESEYLINKVPCRLKDIRSIFLDTGLEVKSYSILEQGRINEILNSKPEERRFLIEEVAGVMKYKVRRAEAIQKLEASRYNLQRLQDIIAEVKRQINSIERYVRKAERYKRLLEEVRDIDVRIARREVRRLADEISGLSSTIEGMRLREAELSTKVQSISSLIEKKRVEFIDREKGLEELRRGLHEAERVVTEMEGRIALLRRDCENLRDRREGLKKRDADLIIEKEIAMNEISKIEDGLNETGHELKEAEASLIEKGETLKGLEQEIAGYEEVLDNERKVLFHKAEEGSILRNELRHLSTIIDDIGRKVERLLVERRSIETGLSSIQDELLKRDNEHQGLDSMLLDKKNERDILYNELDGKRERLKFLEDNLYKGREEIAAMNSRHESLKEIYTAQRMDISGDARFLCKIADILDTSPEYESAIEAVLGDKLSAIIVESHQDIVMAIKRLKEQNAKRSGFISLNPLRCNTPPLNHGYAEDGVIGSAMDLVKVKDGFNDVVHALLSNVLVVKDIDIALSIKGRMNNYPFYLVTLDAEVIEPSGMVYGGIEGGLLRIRREIRELERDIELKRETIINNERAIKELIDEIKRDEERVALIDSEIIEGQRRYHELGLKINNLKEEIGRHDKRLKSMTIEIENEEKERGNLILLMEEKERRHGEIETERADIERRMKELQEVIIAKKGSLEDVRSNHTEIKLRITSMNERMRSLQNEMERLRANIAGYEKKMRDVLDEITSIERDIRIKEAEIEEIGNGIRSHIILADGLREDVTRSSEALSVLSDELKVHEAEERVLTSELNKIREEIGQLEMKRMELSLRLNYIKEDIKKTYNISIDSVDEAVEVSPEEEERLSGLKERLQELGPVSLGTLEEYEELKARLEFLERQQNDLLESIATLEETIQRINRSTTQRLTDAFNALNEKFKEVFKTLFGEGRAELILTGGSILDAGIEIIAQPPGKRLKNLLALSGGEQALTAISLLFAGFMVKPTPMCIMDEVDAPLDESNTDRFVKMLSELSREIQFIIMTHNRVTMSVADYIYGVTMEEPGVSKVISMHMAEISEK